MGYNTKHILTFTCVRVRSLVKYNILSQIGRCIQVKWIQRYFYVFLYLFFWKKKKFCFKTTIEPFLFNCRLILLYRFFGKVQHKLLPPTIAADSSARSSASSNMWLQACGPQSSLEGSKTLIFPVLQQKVTHSALCSLSSTFCSSLFANPAASADPWSQAGIWMQFLHHLVCHRWNRCVTDFWSFAAPRCSAKQRPGASAVNLVNTVEVECVQAHE